MATIDTQNNIIVLHIVYDGTTAAGKTACLHALRTVLKRDMLIFSPAESDAGETLYFDWMEYQGGYFKGGYNILCQIITVPGREALQARRHFLLELADVVIFVADASNLTEETIHYFKELQEVTPPDNEPFKIVVQANKQDLEDAIPAEECQKLLEDADVRIVETSAITNVGIREAFVMAVSFAIKRADGLMSKGQLRFGAPDIANHEVLLEILSKQDLVQEDDVLIEETALDTELEELANESVLVQEEDALIEETALDTELEELADETVLVQEDDALEELAIEETALDAKLEELADESVLVQEDDALIEETALDAKLEELADETVLVQEDDALIEQPVLAAAALGTLATGAVLSPQSFIIQPDSNTTTATLPVQESTKHLPVLPEENPPLQWISPPLAGRKILQQMFSYPLKPHLTQHDVWTVTAANQWCCISKPDWQYSDENQACAALRDFTALQLHYSPLLPAQRCLVLSQQEQNWRLWQITHQMPNLNELLAQALTESELEKMVLETFRCASRYIEVCRKSAEYAPHLNICLDTIGVDIGAHLVYLGNLEEQVDNSVCLNEDSIKIVIKHHFAPPIHHAMQQTHRDIPYVLEELNKIQPFDVDIVVVQTLTEIFETAA